MGMPESIFNFKEKQSTFLRRLGRGTVCYVLVDAKATEAEYYTIDTRFDAAEAIKTSKVKAELEPVIDSMFAYGAAKVLVAAAKDFTTMQEWLVGQRYNYLATDAVTAEMVAWAEGINFRAGRRFILVSDGAACKASSSADNRELAGRIVSVYPESKDAKLGKPAHIAAIIAGCNDRAATNVVLGYTDELTTDELLKYPSSRSKTADDKINAGVLTVVNDGEKIKIGRGVTTYYASSEATDTTKSPFAKIRCVDTLNLVEDDIRGTFDNQFSGQSLNGYEDKMAFISLINSSYLDGLRGTALHAEGVNAVDIDIKKHIEIARAEGEDVESMSEMDLRKYPTGDTLYLVGNIRPLDAMEGMVIDFSVG